MEQKYKKLYTASVYKKIISESSVYFLFHCNSLDVNKQKELQYLFSKYDFTLTLLNTKIFSKIISAQELNLPLELLGGSTLIAYKKSFEYKRDFTNIKIFLNAITKYPTLLFLGLKINNSFLNSEYLSILYTLFNNFFSLTEIAYKLPIMPLLYKTLLLQQHKLCNIIGQIRN